MQAVGQLFQRMDAGRIDSCHVAQPKNHNILEVMKVPGRFHQFFRRSKEKRAMNAQDRYIRGDVLVLKDVRLAIFQVFRGHSGNSRCLRDAVDVKQCGEGHLFVRNIFSSKEWYA